MNKLSKRALRSQLKSILRDIPQKELEIQSANILHSLKPLLAGNANVGCFMNMENAEVKTMPIMQFLIEHNTQVYLPRCTNTSQSKHVVLRPGINSHAHLTFHRMNSFSQITALHPSGKYQLKEPALEEPHPLPPHLDILLVPGVAFCLKNGARMGHGAGFYDDYIQRTFHHNGRKPILIGLALNEQIVDDIPLETHDHHMDCIVCGDGSVHWFQNGSKRS